MMNYNFLIYNEKNYIGRSIGGYIPDCGLSCARKAGSDRFYSA